jgi:hypothetical protein
MPVGELLPTKRLPSAGDRSPGDPAVRAKLPPEVEWLAQWLDTVFRIPGVGIRFGLDAILGLVPGIGDVTTSVASLYILSAAHRQNVPRITLTRMALNILLETIVGAIPLVGDLFDVCWKSNQRNVELLRRHLAAPPAAAARLQKSDRWFVLLLIVALPGAALQGLGSRTVSEWASKSDAPGELSSIEQWTR